MTETEEEAREEGWYAVLIDGAFGCVYWTGEAWQIPLRTRSRKALPARAEIGPRLEWPEEIVAVPVERWDEMKAVLRGLGKGRGGP